jgi:anti-sigma factor RsiW
MKMMKCDEVKPMLVALADGALGAAEAVRAHMAVCAECRNELESFRADAEMLRREPKPEVPAYLTTRIMAAVRARAGRGATRTSKRTWGMPLVTRVAALVLVAVGIWVGTVLGKGIMGTEPTLAQRLASVESGEVIQTWSTEEER